MEEELPSEAAQGPPADQDVQCEPLPAQFPSAESDHGRLPIDGTPVRSAVETPSEEEQKIPVDSGNDQGSVGSEIPAQDDAGNDVVRTEASEASLHAEEEPVAAEEGSGLVAPEEGSGGPVAAEEGSGGPVAAEKGTEKGTEEGSRGPVAAEEGSGGPVAAEEGAEEGSSELAQAKGLKTFERRKKPLKQFERRRKKPDEAGEKIQEKTEDASRAEEKKKDKETDKAEGRSKGKEKARKGDKVKESVKAGKGGKERESVKSEKKPVKKVKEETAENGKKKVVKRPKPEDGDEKGKDAAVKKKASKRPKPEHGDEEAPVKKKVKRSDSPRTKEETKKREKPSAEDKSDDRPSEKKQLKRKNSEADEPKQKAGKTAEGSEAKKVKNDRKASPAFKREQQPPKDSKTAGKEIRENGAQKTKGSRENGSSVKPKEGKEVKEGKKEAKKKEVKEGKEAKEKKTPEAPRRIFKPITVPVEPEKLAAEGASTPAPGKLIEGGANRVRAAYEAAKEMKQRLAQKEETSASLKFLKAATEAKLQLQGNPKVSSPLFMSPEKPSPSGRSNPPEKPESRKQITKSMDKKIALETFQGMLETLTRQQESVTKVTSFAMECANKGISKQIMDVIMRRLKNEKEHKKRVDLLFLVDSMAQYHYHKKSHGPDYAPIVEGCLARFLTAVAPPNSSSENYQQCVKVVNVWLKRKIMKEGLLKETMAKLGMEAGLNTTQRQYQLQDRALHDPVREMDDMLVDEYGSNAGFQIPGFLRAVDEEEEEYEYEEKLHGEFTAASPAFDERMNGGFGFSGEPLPQMPRSPPPPLPKSPPPPLPSLPSPPPYHFPGSLG